MELLDKFDNFIAEIARQFNEIEEVQYVDLLDKEDFDVYSISMQNTKTGKIEKTFYTFNDCISYILTNNVQEYNFIIEYSALKRIDDICDLVRAGLVDEKKFTKNEQENIIDYMASEFYDIFEGIANDETCQDMDDYEDIVYWIDFLKDASDKKVREEFYASDKEFAKIILNSYCSDVIEEAEYLDAQTEITNNKINSIETITTMARKMLIYLKDELEAIDCSSEEYIKIINYYLCNSITLKDIDTDLAQKIYGNNKKTEQTIKNMLRVIVPYDFYISACLNRDDKYVLFIENNSLEDILNLFMNDLTFNELALKHFFLLNSFERKIDDDIKKDVRDKFAPIPEFDSLSYGYIRRKNNG